MAQKPDIAFIGTGVMGRSMAGHLLAAGHPVHVYNRSRAKALPLVEAGARWHDSAGAAAAEGDVIITMLGFPKDVEETYLGAAGVVEKARKGALLVDMTTSSPVLARRISAAASERSLDAIDAPVSGGDIGAREARLVIMAGGDAAPFERAQPVLSLLGKNISLQGPAGAGQHCKMANQIAGAVVIIAWCEALAYARRAGLDPAKVLASISGGASASWSMTNLAPRALAGNFEPGFYVKHMRKDIGIAVASAEEMGLQLPGLECARSLYERVAAMGLDELGTQALYRLYTSF
jgi:3-hydroxyisobutyrate dehydrogenase